MAREEFLRTSVRLRIDQGVVLLRHGGVPSVACPLMDLSEGGCRCIAPMPALDAQTAGTWRQVLQVKRHLNIEISCPPHLVHFMIQAEVRRADPMADGGVELGLQFLNLAAQQKGSLQKAMLSFATDKVRGAFSPSNVTETSAYLVGAGKGSSSRTNLSKVDDAAPPPAAGSNARHAAAPAGSASRHAAAPGSASRQPAVPGSASRQPGVKPGAQAPLMEMLKARRDSSVSLAPIPPSSAAPAPAPPPPPEPVVTPSGQTTEVEAENLLPAPPPPPAPISETQIQRGDPFRGRRVGEILIKMGKLTQQQVDHAADRARLSGERLGRYMLREGLLLPAELTRALALQSGLPMTDLSDAELPAEVRMIFPFALMQRHEFVPFDQSKKILCVATANPLSAEVVEELERIAQRHVEVFLAQEDLVLLALDKLRPVDKRTERRHVRYRAEFPVRYQFCNRLGRVVEETLHEGVTSDISEGGFMVEGPRPDLGQPEDLRRRGLCVNLTIVVVPHEIKVLCSLRFVKVHEDSKPGEYPWTFGLQVLEITESDKRKLKEACIQAGMRKPGESGGAHLKPFA